jgi:hypothetical protein
MSCSGDSDIALQATGNSDIAAVHIADSYVLIGQFSAPAYAEQ